MAPNKIAMDWNGHGFGDRLLAGYISTILRDNGIDAYVLSSYPYYLVDCPANDTVHRIALAYSWQAEHLAPNMISDTIKRLEALFEKQFVIRNNYIPVVFRELDVPHVDVVVSGALGHKSNWLKWWPYFKELKELFKKNGVTYADVADILRIPGPQTPAYWLEQSIRILNYVKNAKLYLGIETGTGHYISKFASGKGLIIQHGVLPFGFTCLYDYDKIELDVECKNCKIFSRRGICPNNHKCMKELTPRMVFDAVTNRLGSPKLVNPSVAIQT